MWASTSGKGDALRKRVDTGFANERSRDAKERDKETQRFQQWKEMMASTADNLGVVINRLAVDDPERETVTEQKRAILQTLKDDPDVDDHDNPSDDFAADNLN